MMHRDDLAAAIYKKLNAENKEISEAQVSSMVNTLLREIYEKIKEGRSITIRGFGTFKPKVYRGYTNSDIFNEESKAKLEDLEFTRVTFKPGVILRTQIK